MSTIWLPLLELLGKSRTYVGESAPPPDPEVLWLKGLARTPHAHVDLGPQSRLNRMKWLPITGSSEGFSGGSYALHDGRHTRTGSFTVSYLTTAMNNTQGPDVAPSLVYTASVLVLVTEPTDVRLSIPWRDITGANSASSSSTHSVPTNEWTRIHLTATAPPGSILTGGVRVSTVSSSPTGVFYVADWLFEGGSEALPYFDGDTFGAKWNGAPGASTSTYDGPRWVEVTDPTALALHAQLLPLIPKQRALVPPSPLVGHRRKQTWLVDLLDMSDQYVGPLEGVESGSVDFSAHTEIRSSATLSVVNSDVDWHRSRVSIRYRFEDERGVEHVYPLGVFLPTTPATRHSEAVSANEVVLYDKMILLSRDGVPTTWTAAKGRTVASVVAELLASVGETRYTVPDDQGGVLATDMSWEPNTSKLRIINDVLAAANYFSIWVDGTGTWMLEPYVEPTARGVSWTHREGVNAVFSVEFTHELDTFDIPNQVIMVGRAETADDGTELAPPSAFAQNLNPDDPLSIPARGAIISIREDEQDATDLVALQAIADRRLRDLSSVSSTYQIIHAWLPTRINAAVRLEVPSQAIDALTVLQKTSWSWEAAGVPKDASSTLRGVQL